MKGLTFIQPLFLQVIKGNKDMTRRTAVIPFGIDCKNHEDYEGKSYFGKPTKLTINKDNIIACKYCNQIGMFESKPRYKQDEVVYLKEPYMITSCKKLDSGKYEVRIEYKYTNGSKKVKLEEKYKGVMNKWKSPRFMPEWASRYKVKIYSVSLERIQDITEDDCLREGVELIVPRLKAKSLKNTNPVMPLGYSHDAHYRDYTTMKSEAKKKEYPTFRFRTAKDSFITLWNAINGKKQPFHKNPYVFVYSFELCK